MEARTGDARLYVYAATDLRPRQPREIELCARGAVFDWQYAGAMALGVAGSEYLSLGLLKQSETPGFRLIGPAAIGLFWGALLSGGYLSLPTCDPLWAYGAPPEGNVRSPWPLAIAISLLATITAPVLDYAFLGPVPNHWPVPERSARIFIAMGSGLAGSIFPYLVPPSTWAAKLEIERIRVGTLAGGPFVSYGSTF